MIRPREPKPVCKKYCILDNMAAHSRLNRRPHRIYCEESRYVAERNERRCDVEKLNNSYTNNHHHPHGRDVETFNFLYISIDYVFPIVIGIGGLAQPKQVDDRTQLLFSGKERKKNSQIISDYRQESNEKSPGRESRGPKFMCSRTVVFFLHLLVCLIPARPDHHQFSWLVQKQNTVNKIREAFLAGSVFSFFSQCRRSACAQRLKEKHRTHIDRASCCVFKLPLEIHLSELCCVVRTVCEDFWIFADRKSSGLRLMTSLGLSSIGREKGLFWSMMKCAICGLCIKSITELDHIRA